jgi:hypothetical protein
MKKQSLVLIAFLLAVSCKKEDKYTIAAQAASLDYADTGRIPYALNYSLVLKSRPAFTTFGKPVPYQDGHYGLSVLAPFEIEPGNTELYLYDSLNTIVDQFTIDIPRPEAAKEDVIKKISFSGARYIGELTFKYSPVK